MPPKTANTEATTENDNTKTETIAEKSAALVAAVVEPAQWKGPRLKNNKTAHFYVDDMGGADGKNAILGHNAIAVLTEAQWQRRTPAQWGQLIANEVITLSNIPAADVEAVEAAEIAEIARLGRVDPYTAQERTVMRGLDLDNGVKL